MSHIFSLEAQLTLLIILWILTFIFTIFSQNELTLIICLLIFIISYPSFFISLIKFRTSTFYIVEEYFFTSLLFDIANFILLLEILIIIIQIIYVFILS